MSGTIHRSGVFLYRPPELDCPWVVVVLVNAKVTEALPFDSEAEARRALSEKTREFVTHQLANEDLD